MHGARFAVDDAWSIAWDDAKHPSARRMVAVPHKTSQDWCRKESIEWKVLMFRECRVVCGVSESLWVDGMETPLVAVAACRSTWVDPLMVAASLLRRPPRERL